MATRHWRVIFDFAIFHATKNSKVTFHSATESLRAALSIGRNFMRCIDSLLFQSLAGFSCDLTFTRFLAAFLHQFIVTAIFPGLPVHTPFLFFEFQVSCILRIVSLCFRNLSALSLPQLMFFFFLLFREAHRE